MSLKNFVKKSAASTRASSSSAMQAAQTSEELSLTPDETMGSLPIEDIKDRASGDARTLDTDNIAGLVESILDLGLHHPIGIDSQGRLLYGAHRRAALQRIKTEHPEQWAELFPDNRVPVRMQNFDSSKDESRALQIEADENERRRDFTVPEILELAQRMKAAGYKAGKGAPKKGQKAIAPELMRITGKSRRTIQNYLKRTEGNEKKIPAHCTVHARALKALKALRTHPDSSIDDYSERLDSIIKALDELGCYEPEEVLEK